MIRIKPYMAVEKQKSIWRIDFNIDLKLGNPSLLMLCNSILSLAFTINLQVNAVDNQKNRSFDFRCIQRHQNLFHPLRKQGKSGTMTSICINRMVLVAKSSALGFDPIKCYCEERCIETSRVHVVQKQKIARNICINIQKFSRQWCDTAWLEEIPVKRLFLIMYKIEPEKCDLNPDKYNMYSFRLYPFCGSTTADLVNTVSGGHYILWQAVVRPAIPWNGAWSPLKLEPGHLHRFRYSIRWNSRFADVFQGERLFLFWSSLFKRLHRRLASRNGITTPNEKPQKTLAVVSVDRRREIR